MTSNGRYKQIQIRLCCGIYLMFWETCRIPVSPLIMIILIRWLRRLKYLLALKWIQHLLGRLALVKPKFGKFKKSYSKFQGRITQTQLTWKQCADVVYLYLHLCLGIEMLTSCLEYSKCNYPNFCSAPSNFVRGLNLQLTNSAKQGFHVMLSLIAFVYRSIINL